MEPFGLPRGSVRAIITLSLVAVTAALLFVPAAAGTGDVKSMFVMLTGYAVKLYFDVRKEQNAEDGPKVASPEL